MSDSVWSQVAQGGKPVDTLSEYQKWQTLSKEQQATALLQQQADYTRQQATGQGIKNQLDALNVAPVEYGITAAGIPNPGGTAGDVLSRGGYQPGGPGGQLQPGDQIGASSAPGGAMGSTGSQGSGTSYPGQAAEKALGIPMSPLDMATVFSSPDRTRAINEILEKQRTLKMQTIAGMAPAQFPQALDRLIKMGAISPSMAQQALSIPNGREQILAGLLDPNSHAALGLQAAQAGMKPNDGGGPSYVADPDAIAASGRRSQETSFGSGVGGAQATTSPAGQAAAQQSAFIPNQYGMTKVTYEDPNRPGVTLIKDVQTSQLPAFLGTNPGSHPTTNAELNNPNVPMTGDSYAQMIKGYENNTGNPAAKNPNSNATGDGQFIPETWERLAKKQPWAQSMTPAQILSARKDPAKAAALTQEYAKENMPYLQANGLPINAMTLGIAHNAGPDGAVKILNSSPDTPMSRVVSPEALAENPQWKRMTTGDYMRAVGQKYTNKPVDFGGSAGASVAPNSASPQGATPGALAATPGVLPQGSDYTPTTEKNRANFVDQSNKDYNDVAKAREGVAKAQTDQQTLLAAARYAGDASVGANSGFRQAIYNFLDTWTPAIGEKEDGALAALRQKLADQNATNFDLAKLLLQSKLGQESNYFGANGGIGTLNAIGEATPNPNMSALAIKNLMERMAIASQRSVDYGQGLSQYYNDQMRNLTPTDGKVPSYSQIGNYQKQFAETHPPAMYELATQMINGTAKPPDFKKLTPAQQKQAAEIVWRVDPSRDIKLPNGGLLRAPSNRQAPAAALPAPAAVTPAPAPG